MIDDGEVQLVVTMSEVGEIREFWRGQDRGVIFTAPKSSDLEKYLTFSFGSDYRNAAGLSRLRPLAAIPYSKRSFTSDVQVEDGPMIRLSWSEDGAPAWASFANESDAIDFSHYCMLPVDAIRAALADPQGAPLWVG